MSEEERHEVGEKEAGDPLTARPVSRREFLKVAGIAGAAIGVGAGLSGLVAACGGEEETATTASTAAGATTTAAAGAESGEEIKAGYVLPVTGAMAAFGTAASWHIEYFNKNIWKDGFVMGDGKKHKFTVIVEDMQSDSSRAGQLAGNLISQAGVQLIGASASADNVVPVRDTCESMGCPCITYDCPGNAWNAAQPQGGFKWCWHTWFVFEDVAKNFIAAWDMIPTNK
ncbi:MAG: ABC transporter substrate-binding protein, partial [Actinomycetia bacterium]|nr:ABC transporter substrate-binding protein [Actinomycetes bacterium]